MNDKSTEHVSNYADQGTNNAPCEATPNIGPDSRLYLRQRGGTLGAEQLRALQVSLADLQAERPFKRLLITSATRGEGKTHISVNLALTLASEAQRKVLLIDADVRNPSVHSTVGIPNARGFKDWLLEGGDPWTAITKIKRSELYVMSGGRPGGDWIGPTRIPFIQTLLTQVEPVFDLVLLDSPPLLGTMDAKLLGGITDATLMVIRSGSTPRRLIEQAQESLKGQNVLGVVLNRVDPNNAYLASYYDQISEGAEAGIKNDPVPSLVTQPEPGRI
jgi:capsular exopolysaccharide synthesis family protein